MKTLCLCCLLFAVLTGCSTSSPQPKFVLGYDGNWQQMKIEEPAGAVPPIDIEPQPEMPTTEPVIDENLKAPDYQPVKPADPKAPARKRMAPRYFL